jgi:hypothetical protein
MKNIISSEEIFSNTFLAHGTIYWIIPSIWSPFEIVFCQFNLVKYCIRKSGKKEQKFFLFSTVGPALLKNIYPSQTEWAKWM